MLKEGSFSSRPCSVFLLPFQQFFVAYQSLLQGFQVALVACRFHAPDHVNHTAVGVVKAFEVLLQSLVQKFIKSLRHI